MCMLWYQSSIPVGPAMMRRNRSFNDIRWPVGSGHAHVANHPLASTQGDSTILQLSNLRLDDNSSAAWSAPKTGDSRSYQPDVEIDEDVDVTLEEPLSKASHGTTDSSYQESMVNPTDVRRPFYSALSHQPASVESQSFSLMSDHSSGSSGSSGSASSSFASSSSPFNFSSPLSIKQCRRQSNSHSSYWAGSSTGWVASDVGVESGPTPKTFRHYLPSDRRKYSCIHCRAHLARHEELISKSFQGSHGRAYLFNEVINVAAGRAEERLLLTGLHAVADIHCQSCKTTLGWKYERAFERSQKYKEGKFIIEMAHMIKDNGWQDQF